MDRLWRRLIVNKYPRRQHMVQELGVCIALVLIMAGQLLPVLAIFLGLGIGHFLRWRARSLDILWLTLNPFLAAAHYYVIEMRAWFVTKDIVAFNAIMVVIVSWLSMKALAILHQCVYYPRISPKIYSAYLQ